MQLAGAGCPSMILIAGHEHISVQQKREDARLSWSATSKHPVSRVVGIILHRQLAPLHQIQDQRIL